MLSDKVNLGINTGFAVNRFPEPDEWVRIIGDDLHLNIAQITADLLNPDLPAKYRYAEVNKINKACIRHGVNITSAFTGAFTRVNHLAHPNEEVRQHWVSWFKEFINQSVDLGVESIGSHFGIFTAKENNDEKLRSQRRKQNIDHWHEIGEYAKEKGLNYISWEPMSIAREQGETIKEARKLQDDVNKNTPIPFKLCLDVDHGQLLSLDPDDTNPHAWIREFSQDANQIHIKQSSRDKRSNSPFTKKFNEAGRINPGDILETITQSGYSKVELLFELSFREREPSDSTVVEQLKESVEFWHKYLPK